MMTYSLSIQDKLRAASVKRWHIVATARSQSVAEHSFNVAMIALELCRKLPCATAVGLEAEIMHIALHHDLDEVIEGDIPSPQKGDKLWGDINAETIVRIADLIEAYAFIKEFGQGRHAKEVCHWVSKQYRDMVESYSVTTASVIESVCAQIMAGDFRIE